MILASIIILGVAGFLFWFWKRGLLLLAERNATQTLDKLLFPEGDVHREKIIESMIKITKGKYSQELLMDYFLKIKGLQVINLYDPVNFWTRKYLMTPTKLRLNYFEQVRFYETFLNYPEVIGKVIKNNEKAEVKTYIEAENTSEVFYKTKQLSKKFA